MWVVVLCLDRCYPIVGVRLLSLQVSQPTGEDGVPQFAAFVWWEMSSCIAQPQPGFNREIERTKIVAEEGPARTWRAALDSALQWAT